jgi:hypothetical protein
LLDIMRATNTKLPSSYLFDYLQKQGFHLAAKSFLEECPDVPVILGPGQSYPSPTSKGVPTPREADSTVEPSTDNSALVGTAKKGRKAAATAAAAAAEEKQRSLKNGVRPASPSQSVHSDYRTLPTPLVKINSPEGFLFNCAMGNLIHAEVRF